MSGVCSVVVCVCVQWDMQADKESEFTKTTKKENPDYILFSTVCSFVYFIVSFKTFFL